MATFAQLAQIAASQEFLSRVQYAMNVAAANVYAELAATNAATPAGSNVLHFAASPAAAVVGAPVSDFTTAAGIPAGTTVAPGGTGTTVVMSANAVGAGVASGDLMSFVANHSARASFAVKVASGGFSLQAAAFAVLTNATIAAEAQIGGGNNIPDSDIQFAVNSLWNLLAGV